MKTKTETITRTVKVYEPGDVVYDIALGEFFLVANRTPEHDHVVPMGMETFSAFRLCGRHICDPRVIAQDPDTGNEHDTVRYVGTLYDYWKGLESKKIRIGEQA